MTPWVVVGLHAPWYNSNEAHQNEFSSFGMKDSFEQILYDHGVDVVFSGHVHAYERIERVLQGKGDACGPAFVNIGDGGNREGLAVEVRGDRGWVRGVAGEGGGEGWWWCGMRGGEGERCSVSVVYH